MLCHRPGPRGSQVCVGMRAPAMMASALWSVCRLCKLEMAASTLVRSRAVSSTCVHSYGPSVGLSLSGEQRQSTGLEQWLSVAWGVHGGGPSTQAVVQGRLQSAASMLLLGGSKCVRSLQEQSLGYLWPSSKPHRFSSSLRGLIFQIWTPGPEYLICRLNPSLPGRLL